MWLLVPDGICLPTGFHMPPRRLPYAARRQEAVGFLFFCLFFSQIMINFTCRKTCSDLLPTVVVGPASHDVASPIVTEVRRLAFS